MFRESFIVTQIYWITKINSSIITHHEKYIIVFGVWASYRLFPNYIYIISRRCYLRIDRIIDIMAQVSRLVQIVCFNRAIGRMPEIECFCWRAYLSYFNSKKYNQGGSQKQGENGIQYF